MDKDLVEQVVDAAARVVASGAISRNGHGNVSLRRPGGGRDVLHRRPLAARPPGSRRSSGSAWTATLREGDLPPIQGAVVAMHTAMYADRPEVGCVLHTHSPYATAYAVARRPIGCWVEALAMFGLPDGVPVAGYGPRGSERGGGATSGPPSGPGVPAVLLANHGVLVFHRTPGARRSWSAGSSRRPRRPASTRPALGGPVEIEDADARGGAAARDGLRPAAAPPTPDLSLRQCAGGRRDADQDPPLPARCRRDAAGRTAAPRDRAHPLRVTRGGFSTLDLPDRRAGSPSRAPTWWWSTPTVYVQRHALAGTYRELGAAAGIDAGSPRACTPTGPG